MTTSPRPPLAAAADRPPAGRARAPRSRPASSPRAASAGIKASGRPDLAIVATLPGADGDRRRRPRPRSSPRTRSRPRPSGCRRPTSPRPSRRASGRVRLGDGDHLDERLRQRRDRAPRATPTRPRSPAFLAGALGTPRRADAPPLDRGHRDAAAARHRRGRASTRVAPTPRRDRRRRSRRPPRRSGRPTRGRRPRRRRSPCPIPDGLAVRSVRVTGIAKGVGMIHPRMATMLVDRPDRRDGRPGDAPRAAPAGRRADLGPAQRRRRHEHERHRVRPRLGRGRRGAGRRPARARRAELGRAIEAVARDLARQQAADGEGATTLITCQVSGAVDDADARAVARAVVSSSLVKAAVHGRDPNWGRIAGAAGNARLADAAVLEAAGLAPPTPPGAGPARPPTLDPDRLRIAIAGHLVFDGAGRRPGRVRPGRGARRDGRARSS